MSHSYLWKRLEDQLPLNLNDVDALAAVLGLAPGALIARAELHARPIATVVEGRFRQMGSGHDFSDRAVAQHSEVSIFDEQDQSGEIP